MKMIFDSGGYLDQVIHNELRTNLEQTAKLMVMFKNKYHLTPMEFKLLTYIAAEDLRFLANLESVQQ